MTCGPNQVYSDHISGCQANCVNRDSETSCHLPYTEGCACKDGYILSGKECIRVEDCGCNSEVGYIEVSVSIEIIYLPKFAI